MSWFPRPSSPSTAVRDLIAVMRHSSREQRIAAGLALVATGIIVGEFVIESKWGIEPTPTPTYVELDPTNRTDADIIAQQKKEEAERAAGEKEKQRQFKKLEKRLGIG
jgi:hypothetical protein